MKILSFWRKPVYLALVFFGTLLALSVGYGLTGNLSSADKVASGSTLSSLSWNRVVDGIGDLDTRLLDLSSKISSFSFAGGNVGLGVSPSVKLDVNGSMSVSNMPMIKCTIPSSTVGNYMPLSAAIYSVGNISSNGDSIIINESGTYLIGFVLGFSDASHGWLVKNKGVSRELSWDIPTSGGIFSNTTVLYLSAGDTLQILHYRGTFTVDYNQKYFYATKLH